MPREPFSMQKLVVIICSVVIVSYQVPRAAEAWPNALCSSLKRQVRIYLHGGLFPM